MVLYFGLSLLHLTLPHSSSCQPPWKTPFSCHEKMRMTKANILLVWSSGPKGSCSSQVTG